MKRLSSTEAEAIVNQIENLIKSQSFDEAITLGRNALKTSVFPDKISINAISKHIKQARSLKRNNPQSKSQKSLTPSNISNSKTTPYRFKNYCTPNYQSFKDETENKHLESLIQYIKQQEDNISRSTQETKSKSSHSKSTASPNHEEIVQIGIDNNLEKENSARQDETLHFAKKAIKRPFFARFDFNDSESQKIIYISDTNTNRFINSYGDVKYVDWRAPITKLYYSYQRPIKNVSFRKDYYGQKEIITGNVDLIAQYTIENSEMKNYSFDSFDKNHIIDSSNDDILQEKLKGNSSTHMKAHADTLQTEQYYLTSYDPNEDLIIQGVAGSGKTVIALSRLVYLKYEENKNFSNDNILYISPNADFSEYVSNVSIGLGETRIPIKTIELVIDGIFNIKTGKQSTIHWEDLSSFAEKYSTKKSPTIKKLFTKSFQNKFYNLCNKLNNEALLIKDYNQTITKLNDAISSINESLKNKNGILKSLIKEQAEFTKQKKALPNEIQRLRNKIAKKIERGALDVDESIEELKTLEADAKATESGLKIVSKQIKGAFSDISKVQRLLEKTKKTKEQTKNILIRKLKCIELQGKKDNSTNKYYIKPTISNKPYIEINSDYSVKIVISPNDYYSSIIPIKSTNKYKYENLPYYMIVKFLLERANGNNLENHQIKHIVVDEAQDYSEPYYYLLRQAFPNAVFTILGDKNQNVNPFFKYTSLENLIPDAKYSEINIAYRSSPEIVEYCNQILKLKGIHSKRKSQGIDVVEKTIKTKAVIESIVEETNRLHKLGLKRINVITSNQKNANIINNKLDALYLNNKSKQPVALPVFKAKGLEYDAVIVINDYKKNSKDLFYVACTRAKHALTVIKTK